MALTDGKCPLCGNEIRVPDDQEKTFCSSCGEEILTEAAISYHQATLVQPDDMEPNRSGPTDAPAVPMATEEVVLVTADNVVNSTADNSFLNNWKTNVLGTIVGIVLLLLVNYKLSTSVSSVSFFLLCLIQIAAIIYAVAFYSSLFKSNPLMKSNYFVSICNGFFGGAIFGPLWNSNLTKKNRGISHYIFAVIMAISLFALLVMTIPYLSSNSASTNTYSNGTVAQTPAASIDSKFVGTWTGYDMWTPDTIDSPEKLSDYNMSMTLTVNADGTGKIVDNFSGASKALSKLTFKSGVSGNGYQVFDANGEGVGALEWGADNNGTKWVVLVIPTDPVVYYSLYK